MLSLIFAVHVIAAVAAVATTFLIRISADDLTRFAILAVCAGASNELTRHIERMRSEAHKPYVAYVNTMGVWNFAAIIILPPVLASAMVLVTFSLAWFRVRKGKSELYRWLFSGATVLLGTQVAALVLSAGVHAYPGVPAATGLDGFSELGVVAFAAGLRWVINAGLVMAAIALSNPTVSAGDLFENFSQQLLEVAAMALGLVVAFVVVTNPFVLPGVLIAMLSFHGAFLVSQFEHASRVDAKTGLAQAGRWHEFAEHTLARAQQRGSSMGLLIVDLDHFKAVNDTYGHPFGDEVLRAVAKELHAEIRDQDACGRWGGEEFAIALPDVDSKKNLRTVAERIRQRIAAVVLEAPHPDGAKVTITASVGAAIYPAEGIAALDDLLLAADAALYDAKNSGRNAVRLSPTVPDSPAEVAASIEKSQHTDGSRLNPN